ncbi:hypothetical protein AAG747_17975 [Rapidithrix thailandica]|uniref:Uncharacterized protein n=1 Tax=Rapidithrix thailandica TaxID=413964 RepID=A0AAW9S7H4_9BACT
MTLKKLYTTLQTKAQFYIESAILTLVSLMIFKIWLDYSWYYVGLAAFGIEVSLIYAYLKWPKFYDGYTFGISIIYALGGFYYGYSSMDASVLFGVFMACFLFLLSLFAHIHKSSEQ